MSPIFNENSHVWGGVTFGTTQTVFRFWCPLKTIPKPSKTYTPVNSLWSVQPHSLGPWLMHRSSKSSMVLMQKAGLIDHRLKEPKGLMSPAPKKTWPGKELASRNGSFSSRGGTCALNWPDWKQGLSMQGNQLPDQDRPIPGSRVSPGKSQVQAPNQWNIGSKACKEVHLRNPPSLNPQN